jgi:hypothetical protein
MSVFSIISIAVCCSLMFSIFLILNAPDMDDDGNFIDKEGNVIDDNGKIITKKGDRFKNHE